MKWIQLIKWGADICVSNGNGANAALVLCKHPNGMFDYCHQ